MHSATLKLWQELIRLAKGMLGALGKWLDERHVDKDSRQ